MHVIVEELWAALDAPEDRVRTLPGRGQRPCWAPGSVAAVSPVAATRLAYAV